MRVLREVRRGSRGTEGPPVGEPGAPSMGETRLTDSPAPMVNAREVHRDWLFPWAHASVCCNYHAASSRVVAGRWATHVGAGTWRAVVGPRAGVGMGRNREIEPIRHFLFPLFLFFFLFCLLFILNYKFEFESFYKFHL
jgi:hypothetical protein